MKLSNISLPAESQPSEWGAFREGTADVNIKGRTRTAEIKVWDDKPNEVWIKGMVGRYHTASKVWPASVRFNTETGSVYANFGRDDRHPKFRKEDCIFFPA